MKLTDNAEFAMQMLFDDEGKMDEAFILKAWPYSSMDPGEIDKLKSGLMELEAFGLVESRNVIVSGRQMKQIWLKKKHLEDAEPLWTRDIDVSIPVQ